MCGIVGFINGENQQLFDMMSTVDTRGPDDEDYLINEDISLGHKRLSIIDPHSRGCQPMTDQDLGLSIVYNGEVYNFQEIREDLKSFGYNFNTQTDTEVILRAYDRWGKDCLDRFNGMFSFVIYDEPQQKLFISRDHVGIKPLYYYKEDNNFVFGSTIPSVLDYGIDTKPNPEAIRDFLSFKLADHTSETFFSGIHKFPEGHYAEVDLDTSSVSFTKWWDILFNESFDGSRKEAVAKLRSLIRQSVRRRLVSDVPVGTNLSGGIDSSAITGIASDDNSIDTFSVVFPGSKWDESEYIDEVIRKTDVKSHRVRPDPETFRSNLSDFIRAMGQPVGVPSAYLQYCLYETSSDQGTTVILDGQGADELFGGYQTSRSYYIRGMLANGEFADSIKELINVALNNDTFKPFFYTVFLLLPRSVQSLYYQSQSDVSDELRSHASKPEIKNEMLSAGSLQGILEFRITYTLQTLLRNVDRMSMRHSQEARVPFLDPRLIEFVSSLPKEYFIDEGRSKGILREALVDIIPEEVASREDKIGFAAPKTEWLKNDIFKKLLKQWFLRETPLCSWYVDTESVRRRVFDVLDGNPETTERIWRVIFLEAWLREFEEQFTEVSPAE